MLAYSRTGLLNNPPLLFLHGLFGSKEDWEGVCQFLQTKFCCYAFDLPGHGASFSEPTTLDTIVETIEALNLEKSPVVGYSMGGRLALQMKFPKAVVIGAHLGLTTPEEKSARLATDLKWVERLETEPLELVLRDWYAQPIFHTLKKTMIAKRTRQDPRGVARALRAWSLAHQPRIFPSNCLFLVGEEDLKFANYYSTLQLSFKTIASSSHAAHLENPKACADAIQSFMETP